MISWFLVNAEFPELEDDDDDGLDWGTLGPNLIFLAVLRLRLVGISNGVLRVWVCFEEA